MSQDVFNTGRRFPRTGACRSSRCADRHRRVHSAHSEHGLSHLCRAQGDRLHAEPHRAEPRRLSRPAAAVRRRDQADAQGNRHSREREPLPVPHARRCSRWSRPSRPGRSCRSAPMFVLADIDAGLLYVLALTSLGVYGVILAGWATNSKYAFLGAMRSAAQIVAYEIAMGFALVGVLMASRQPQPRRHRARAGGRACCNWFWLPLLPLASSTSSPASPRRIARPSTSSEGESEIVAGFHVEYSGMAFAMFFVAEYVNMILDLARSRRRSSSAAGCRPFEGIPGLGSTLARGAELLLARAEDELLPVPLSSGSARPFRAIATTRSCGSDGRCSSRSRSCGSPSRVCSPTCDGARGRA